LVDRPRRGRDCGVLTMADITSDLEVWWKGDGSSSTLTDYAGGSIGNGTLSGNTALITGITDHPNGLKNSVKHTAVNGKVTSVGNFDIPETSDVTFAWWQKMDTDGNSYVIGTNDSIDWSATLFQGSQTQLKFQPGSSNTDTYTFAMDLSDLGWHHFAVIFDSSLEDVHVWIDGVFSQTDDTVAHATAWTLLNKLMLFERVGAGLTMIHQMCDIRVYSRALATSTDPDLNIAALFAYTESVNRARRGTVRKPVQSTVRKTVKTVT